MTTREELGSTRGNRFSHRIGAGLAAALLVSLLGPSTTAASAGAQKLKSKPKSNDARIDLGKPTFTRPTSITNPLFPISKLTQVVQLGEEAGEKLRHEITLLDDTKVIQWDDKSVETVVSQFVAYGDGRILEVAVDYFAQADDGSVWYFGENVDNYEDGVIADHEGTWLAGRDGPPGMIMPAKPKVGDVYRPENIPGLVFEEVTVKSINETVAGPRGPIKGAMLVEERLQDGTLEDKIFAPGYGEFEARVTSADELVTVAIAVPIDAGKGAVPAALSTLSNGSISIFDAAASKRWDRAGATFERMTAAWEGYRGGDVPPLLESQMSEALDALDEAVEAQKPGEARQASIDVSHASLDLQLQHRSPAEVDRARLATWQRQIAVDRAARDFDGVAGDNAVIKAIRNRLD